MSRLNNLMHCCFLSKYTCKVWEVQMLRNLPKVDFPKNITLMNRNTFYSNSIIKFVFKRHRTFVIIHSRRIPYVVN